MMKIHLTKHEYQRPGILYHLGQIIWHRWVKGEVLKVELDVRPQTAIFGKQPKYRRYEYWTNEKTSELRSIYDYKKAIKWYDSLIWMGVPVWLKIRNVEQFDIRQRDKSGNFIYSQDTAATLNDVMTSNATSVFIKQMAKIAMSKMDLQTMILMAIIGVGAVVGLHYLGIF